MVFHTCVFELHCTLPGASKAYSIKSHENHVSGLHCTACKWPGGPFIMKVDWQPEESAGAKISRIGLSCDFVSLLFVCSWIAGANSPADGSEAPKWNPKHENENVVSARQPLQMDRCLINDGNWLPSWGFCWCQGLRNRPFLCRDIGESNVAVLHLRFGAKPRNAIFQLFVFSTCGGTKK